MDSVRRAEEAHLQTLQTLLIELIGVLEKEVALHRDELLQSRVGANEETHLIRDFDDVVAVSIAEQAVREVVDDVAKSQRALGIARRQLASPYFARIDFQPESAQSLAPVYIGRHGLLDKQTMTMPIHDWRSPIASLFYDFDVGEAAYETPGGLRCGRLTLKRQFKIEAGELLYLFDADVTVNDELLGQALAESGDGRLKVIVSSIQREQNAAIRHDPYTSLLVTGAAGSGKTSVGMHRLAWLLYRDREKLKAGDCVIVSASAVFGDYIAGILPELGEEEVRRAVFDELFRPYAPRGWRFTDYFELVSRVAGEPDAARLNAVKVKSSNGFRLFLEQHFHSFHFTCNDVVFRGTTICAADELCRQARDGGGNAYPFPIALKRIEAAIRKKCADYFEIYGGTIKNQIAEESSESLFGHEVNRLYKEKTHAFVEGCVHDFLAANGVENVVALYVSLLAAYVGDAQAPLVSQTKRRAAKKAMQYEDLMAILYIKALLGQLPTQPSGKHVLLDEAQDYSAFQLALLRHVYGKAVFTVLADPLQAIYPAITDDALLPTFFADTTRLTLQKSYRCTQPIFDYAYRFVENTLAHANPAEGYARNGDAPIELSTDDVVATLAEILSTEAARHPTIGILTATKREARLLHRALSKAFDVHLISAATDTLTTGITILPAMLVKGLEFDCAILAGDFEAWNARTGGRLLYTLCTRALHKLYRVGATNG